MKQLLINFLTFLLCQLVPEETVPTKKLNYQKLSATILSQTPNGRQTFYRTFFQSMDASQVREIYVILRGFTKTLYNATDRDTKKHNSPHRNTGNLPKKD